MTDLPAMSSKPTRLLLATDLSPRCDRALDRSVQLAQAWNASLTALSVLDGPKAPDQVLAWLARDEAYDPQEEARRQLTRELTALGTSADIRLLPSRDTAATISAVARELDASLVLTGVACDEPLGRFLLGSSVEHLARALERPLLIVRNRPHGMYGRVAVASDLSDRSRAALQAAVQWFDGAGVDFFHARPGPGGGWATGAQRREVHLASTATQRNCKEFVVQSGVPAHRMRDIVAVAGPLEPTLTRHVRQQAIELVVMGSREGAGLLGALTGSMLEKLLPWIPCDVLVVPSAG